MNPNRREKKRTATLDEIRSTAWMQIGQMGPASLSLRGIAREMGMTAPALYRYYKDRETLVTALLIDAFTDFSATLEAARDGCAADDHAGRFRAICKAYFTWAAQNPQRYALLFGTPIPGSLFAKELGPVAQRSFLVLQGMIGEAHAAGKMTGELTALRLPIRLKSQYETLRKMGMPYTPLVTHLALSIWSMMHGVTSLYLHHYLTGFLQENVESYVDFEIEKAARGLGLA
ncbi:MAG TPA: TetR/AcrR family transcriptional regulator [Anaerolineales bacterium]|nr:TetR/AcrR family transcriptional regulator [Anaerolineales bacterium]